MTVTLNNTLLILRFILMVTDIRMAVCLRSQMTGGGSTKDWYNLDLLSRHLNSLMESLKDLCKLMQMPPKKASVRIGDSHYRRQDRAC
jgi:hypothetical protein